LTEIAQPSDASLASIWN